MQTKVFFDHGPFGNKHNNLFRPGPRMRLNACVGKNGGPAGFDRYARGYFEAGARLVASLKEDSWGVDTLIYPLVMVYRHGIEIALKHLGKVLPPLCDKKPEVKSTHKLLDNWNSVRGLMKELGEDGDTIKQMDSLLQDFVEIDPRGENFRYPETRDGSRVLQDTSLINVEVFGENMAFLAQFLEGACYWAEHLREMKADQMAYEWEMQQDYAQDMAYYGQE
jgi:hypothetical protein